MFFPFCRTGSENIPVRNNGPKFIVEVVESATGVQNRFRSENREYFSVVTLPDFLPRRH